MHIRQRLFPKRGRVGCLPTNNLSLRVPVEFEDDPLRFWEKHQSSFPILSVVTRVGLYLGMSATSVPVPVECVFSRHTTGIISNGKRSSTGPAKLNLGFVQFSGKGPPVCGVTSFYNYWYAVILPVIVCHAKWLRRRQVGLREKRKSYDLKFKLLVEKAGGSGRLYE